MTLQNQIAALQQVLPTEQVDSTELLIGSYTNRHGELSTVTKIKCSSGRAYIMKALGKISETSVRAMHAQTRLTQQFNQIASKHGFSFQAPRQYFLQQELLVIQDFAPEHFLDWEEAYGYRSTLLATTAAEIHFCLAQLPLEIQASLVSIYPKFPNLPEQIIHGDLNPLHLGISHYLGKESVTAVIDWDRASVGSRLWDLSRRIFPIARWNDQDPEVYILWDEINKFISNYQDRAIVLGNPLSAAEIAALPDVLAKAQLDAGNSLQKGWNVAAKKTHLALINRTRTPTPPAPKLSTMSSDPLVSRISLTEDAGILIATNLVGPGAYTEARIGVGVCYAKSLLITAEVLELEYDRELGGEARAHACLSLYSENSPQFALRLPSFVDRDAAGIWRAEVILPSPARSFDQLVFGFSATQSSLRNCSLAISYSCS